MRGKEKQQWLPEPLSQPQGDLAGPLETHPQSPRDLEPPITAPAPLLAPPLSMCRAKMGGVCPPFHESPPVSRAFPAPSQASLSGLRLNQKDSP